MNRQLTWAEAEEAWGKMVLETERARGHRPKLPEIAKKPTETAAEVKAAVIEAVKAGLDREEVAKAAGVTPKTAWRVARRNGLQVKRVARK